jgi:hypothetical protein
MCAVLVSCVLNILGTKTGKIFTILDIYITVLAIHKCNDDIYNIVIHRRFLISSGL